MTPETRTTPLPEFALSTPATATVLGDREESRTPGLGVSRQFLRVVGVGRRRYLPPVGATAPPGTTPYGSIRGVCGLIVDRAIRGSALESSDRCNCKVFGAREENRTPDLLITSELLCRLSYPGEDHTLPAMPMPPAIYFRQAARCLPRRLNALSSNRNASPSPSNAGPRSCTPGRGLSKPTNRGDPLGIVMAARGFVVQPSVGGFGAVVTGEATTGASVVALPPSNSEPQSEMKRAP